MLFVEVAADEVAGKIANSRWPIAKAHVLADGDELHFRRDDALPGIPELRDRMAFASAERAAAMAIESGKFHEPVAFSLARVFGVLAGEIAVVHRLHFAALIFGDIAARLNPFGAHTGQTVIRSAIEIGITPRRR